MLRIWRKSVHRFPRYSIHKQKSHRQRQKQNLKQFAACGNKSVVIAVVGATLVAGRCDLKAEAAQHRPEATVVTTKRSVVSRRLGHAPTLAAAAQQFGERVAEIARAQAVDERIGGRVAVAEPEEDVEENRRRAVTTERLGQVDTADDDVVVVVDDDDDCLLYTSPSPRDRQKSRMPSSA